MEVIDLTSDAEPEVILQAKPCEPIDLTFDEEDDSLDDPGEPVYLASDAETADFSEDSDVDRDLDDGSKYLNEENSRKITSFLFEKMKEWEEKIKQQRRPTRYAKGVPLNSRPLSTQQNTKNKLKKDIVNLENLGQLYIPKFFKTSSKPKPVESLKTSETKKRYPVMEEEEEEEGEEGEEPVANKNVSDTGVPSTSESTCDTKDEIVFCNLKPEGHRYPTDEEEEEEEDSPSQDLFRSALGSTSEKVHRDAEPVGGLTHIPPSALQVQPAGGLTCIPHLTLTDRPAFEEEEEEEEDFWHPGCV